MPASPRRLEQHVGAEDVGLDELARRLDRPVDVGLRGEVDDRADPLEAAVDRVGVGDVGGDQLDPGLVEALEVLHPAGVGELVEHPNREVGMGLEAVADVGGADEPGAAGDEDVHRDHARLARRQVLAQPLMPVGQADRIGALGDQQRERRPRGRAAEHLGRPRHHPAVDAGLVEDLLRVLEPGAAPGRGDVVDAVLLGFDEQGQRLRQMRGVGGARDLVGDDDHLGLLGADPQHRLDEVRPVGPEQPRGTDDEVARVGDLRRGLAGLLRATVGGDRAREVGLDVGRALGAVEDVVAGDVEGAGAVGGGRCRDDPGGGVVDPHRAALVGLGAVHVGPGRGVDDRVGSHLGDRVLDRLRVGDVELGA